jgi:putative oxidoreductase
MVVLFSEGVIVLGPTASHSKRSAITRANAGLGTQRVGSGAELAAAGCMPHKNLTLRDRINNNHDLGWDALRIYLGFVLFLKGAAFLLNLDALREIFANSGFDHPSLAEPLAVTHLAGGLMLTFGLFTRIAAAVQLPILAAALVFVHGREGMFRPEQGFEYALLILVLLTLFAIGGAGRISVDWSFKYTMKRPPTARVRAAAAT